MSGKVRGWDAQRRRSELAIASGADGSDIDGTLKAALEGRCDRVAVLLQPAKLEPARGRSSTASSSQAFWLCVALRRRMHYAFRIHSMVQYL